jgi:magnesium transporter
MPKSIRKGKTKDQPLGGSAGLSPGTLVFVGQRKRSSVRVDVLAYTETTFGEQKDVSVDHCRDAIKAPGVTWINVNGIHDIGLIEALGKYLNLHPLTMEDIVNTSQRPKAEVFPGYIYTVLKMISFNETRHQVEMEHVSLILSDHFVVSFQEDEGDLFDAVRERIRSAKGRIRQMGADYLAYALMDAVVDHYFLTVEHIGDRIEDFDDRILADPKPEDIQQIHRFKRDILGLRKAVWPLREEVSTLEKTESALIRAETRVFLRDLYDHTIQVIDMVETFRDILGGMHDTYLSSLSNRMNEVMKVLTVIATLFIPLTFIAGVYGMNFEHMPELKWRWGYGLIWGVMLAVGLGMVGYFKKKKWF